MDDYLSPDELARLVCLMPQDRGVRCVRCNTMLPVMLLRLVDPYLDDFPDSMHPREKGVILTDDGPVHQACAKSARKIGKPMVTAEDEESLLREQQDAARASGGRRRRSHGSGYSGGTGMVDI